LSPTWSLVYETVSSEAPLTLLNNDGFQAWLDADRFTLPLVLRRWNPGDAIVPLGMKGHVKLSDLFINLQVPPEARKNYPLISSGDEIVWVPGLRVGQKGALTEHSRRVVHLHLSKTA